jgi:hypothetical protein
MPVIPSDYFGSDSGKIAIIFNNGTEIVSGSIVKQTGTRRYIVSDGASEYTVVLARTIADIENLPPGTATIEVFPYIDGVIINKSEHIHKLEQFSCYTVEGHKFGWRFAKPFMYGTGVGADQDGEGNISQIV